MSGVEATGMKFLNGSLELLKSTGREASSPSLRLRQPDIPREFLVLQPFCPRIYRSSHKQSRSFSTCALNPPNGLAPGSIPSGSEPGSRVGAGEEGAGGRTRLGRFVSARVDSLQDRWRDVRNFAWLKVFALLLGFFLANAIATVIGQTGDWDIIVAGVLVGLVEVFGSFVYRVKPDPKSWIEKATRETVQLVNYLKAGLVFGLFVDAFKVGS